MKLLMERIWETLEPEELMKSKAHIGCIWNTFTAVSNRGLLVCFFFFSCEKRTDVIFVVIPSMEECDTYKLIWKVDSIIVGDQSDVGKQIYFLNSKKNYTHYESECRYTVYGTISDKKIKEHYTDCGIVYRFKDRKVSKNWERVWLNLLLTTLQKNGLWQ